MGPRIKKPHLQKSIIKESLERKISKNDVLTDRSFLLSFKHLDRNQGQSFDQWQESYMLAKTVDTLSNYCCGDLPPADDRSGKFAVYGSFPAKSKFVHPKHVPEDAEWARIHIDGLYIVAGHVVKNIFFVVFLDHDHSFYITEKKNT